jgi:hypothetical protein
MHCVCRIATYWLCRTASGFDAIVPGARCKRCHGRERIHYREMDAEREQVDELRIFIISITVPFNSLYNNIIIDIEREHTSGISSNPSPCLHVRVRGEAQAACIPCRQRVTVRACLRDNPAARPHRSTPAHSTRGQATRGAWLE